MTVSFKLLRIYTDEAAFTADRKSLDLVVLRAHDAKVAGVTVLEAKLGIGGSAHVHRRHLFESDRSVVIEIVDEEDRLRTFATSLGDLSGIGLITIEQVEVLYPDKLR